MNRKAEQLIAECQSQMNAHAMLLYIRYTNFCVKAEPFSLLSVMVQANNREYEMEDICTVDLPDDYTFMVYPNDSCYTTPLIQAIAKEHPEFLLEQEKDPDSDEVALRYTMPKVNDDRFKAGCQYVDVCYDAAKTHIEAAKAKYTVKVVACAKGSDPKEWEDQVQDAYNQFMAQCDEFKATKLAQLEEAHNAYLADMTNVQQNEAEQEISQGINKIYTLNLNEP